MRACVNALLAGAAAVLCAGGCGHDEAQGGSPSSTTGAAPACNSASEPFGADPEAGHSFPDLEYTVCDGSKVTLDTLRCTAQVTLISIGAGWCQPCIAETPALEAAHVELQDEGIQIIQVLFQDAQSNPATTLFCKNWQEMFNLTLPVFVDPAAQSLDYFDSAAAPLNIAVDRDGKVLWAVTGIIPQDLEGTLRALLP